MALNHFANWEILPCALGSHKGLAAFNIDRDMAVNSKIAEDGTDSADHTISVAVEALDDLVREHRVPAPNAIKIDVEGYEDHVLAGAGHVFETARPKLVCEVHTEPVASRVIDFIEGRNYRWTWIGSYKSYPRHMAADPCGSYSALS